MARVALVTGAASGIGRATARLLHDRGYGVVAADLRRAGLEETVAGLANALAVEMEVRRSADAVRAVAEAERAFGGLDAVAHIAGIEIDHPVDVLTEEQWDAVVDTNLKGTYIVCAAAIPALRRRGGGAIVTTGSILGRTSIGGATAYAASKAGVEALTRTMALDYGREGIRVNCVLPGATETPLMWISTPPEQIEAKRAVVNNEVPLGRIAEPSEIARVIAFLLSDDASFVTGASVPADGGQLAKASISA